MFNDIAFRYDFLNRFLSAGIDVRWRKKAIRQLAGKPIGHLLDVATGTADMAIMASGILKPEQITGIDISDGMLDVGRKKIAKLGIFSGDVYGVQLPGIAGLFEVLDKHAPMVSALKEGRLKILKDKTQTASYNIKSGFVEVLNNKTTVLIEGAEEV